MALFRPIDRATPYLLPPSVEDWLPKDHLARFVVDIVDQLDLSALSRQYRGTGGCLPPDGNAGLAHLRLRDGRLFEPAHRGGDA